MSKFADVNLIYNIGFVYLILVIVAKVAINPIIHPAHIWEIRAQLTNWSNYFVPFSLPSEQVTKKMKRRQIQLVAVR